MIKVLLDTNIILDIALRRTPFFEYSAEVIKKIDNKKIIGFITATTISDIYYIAKKEKGHQDAIEFIIQLVELFEIIGIDKKVIQNALDIGFKDFEDSIQESAALSEQVDFIITRNTSDFKNSLLKVLNPEEFIKYFEEKENNL